MAGKVVVRVYFIDNCIKAIGIDQNTTAANLREMVVERIGLVEDACFALFEKKDDWGKLIIYNIFIQFFKKFIDFFVPKTKKI